jgi:hypothetical protein
MPADKTTNKTVQMKFRVDQGFYDLIQAEATKRELSFQEMMLDALKLYFATPHPESWDYALTTFVKHGKGVSEGEARERRTWAALLWKYLNKMPREKIQLLMNAVRYDLDMQQSSRRKKGSRGSARSRQEGA